MTMTIHELVYESFETSKSKGWHDQEADATVGDRLMLMVSELSEALEEFRNGVPLARIYFNRPGCVAPFDYEDGSNVNGKLPKPEGVPVELADVVIRIGDFCGKHGIDLERALRLKMAYNKTRPPRHGGKKI